MSEIEGDFKFDTPEAYKAIVKALEEVLDTLPPREAEVLIKRFGLQDGKSKSLKEIADEYVRFDGGVGVTRERIRQIEAKALRRLRHPKRIAKLKEFMEL